MRTFASLMKSRSSGTSTSRPAGSTATGVSIFPAAALFPVFWARDAAAFLGLAMTVISLSFAVEVEVEEMPGS
ncbi:hypothetical protein LJR175_007824 [Variovorax sp. LjRoot175]|uniref:hypothetical protein n=1 Tax=Variovorax sp. LjRoot175 TaxID=3342276 RepID=UPI003ECDD1BC